MGSPAIETRDLTRTFRPKRTRARAEREIVTALDGISLTIESGQLFGLLGRNGAGKTTLIKILVTLLLPSSGSASVGGFDVVSEAAHVKEKISMVSGGEHTGYGLLTVREQLWMFARFYGMASRPAKERIDALLKVVGLYDVRHRKVGELSTGMRQKMNIVRGLMPDPEILFLDEPTVGLDVGAARDIRLYIKEWIEAKPGRTILLTTHYMHEAEELCDRVAIIHEGKTIADDSPIALRRRAAGGSSFLLTTEPLDGTDPLAGVPGLRQKAARPLDGRTELRLLLEDDGAISGVVQALAGANRRIPSLEKVEPSLEDVFVDLVGERFEADAPEVLT
ncbi:MAG TPA: ABC transporter ATP-binding protein [Actinomycetota bacterium]|nr:ABC transporter ATP-binding protein [Actinomycetota bacterium]